MGDLTERTMAEYLSLLPKQGGIPWPSFCEDWESRLDVIGKFDPRPDDVFVVSYPKCGHHWSHEFLSMIIKGTLDNPKGEWLTVSGWVRGN